MKSIFVTLREHKQIDTKTKQIYTKQQTSVLKQFSKLSSNTFLTLLFQRIQNETNPKNYIHMFVERALDKDVSLDIIKQCLIYLKKSTSANYSFIRVLLKAFEFDDNFMVQYIDNDLLGIIGGEYLRKYEKSISFINEFTEYVSTIFVSYVTVLNYILIDDFEVLFYQAFLLFKRTCFEEICEVLITFVKCEKSIKILQNSIKQVLIESCSKEITVNDFVMDLIVRHFNFFKLNGFINEIAKELKIMDIDKFKMLLNVWNEEPVSYIVKNSKTEIIYDFLISTPKSYFLYFIDKIEFSNFENDQFLDILMIHYFYNLEDGCNFMSYKDICIENLKKITGHNLELIFVSDIRIEFLKNPKDLYFSESFVNGLSFIDKKYNYDEKDLISFIKSIKKQNEKSKEIFSIIEFTCLTQFLREQRLISRFQSELKELLLQIPKLRKLILETLKEVNPIFCLYLEIENINRNHIKEIKLKLELLYGKENDKTIFFDYLFTRHEVLSQMKKFESNSLFISRIKVMKNCDLKKTLLKIYKIDFECEIISEPKIEIKKRKIIFSKIESKAEIDKKIEHNLLFYLDNEISIPREYSLSQKDNFHLNGIREKITAMLIEAIRNKQKGIENDKNLIENIIVVLNLFKNIDMLKILLRNIFAYFKNNNLRASFDSIKTIVLGLEYQIYEINGVIKDFVDNQGFIILEAFIEKINFDQLIELHSIMNNNYFSSIQKSLISKVQGTTCNIKRKPMILKLINHQVFCLDGLKLSNQHLLQDDDCVVLMKKMLVSKCEEYLYEVIYYLKNCEYKFDNEFLYEILFERAKLDNIASLILSVIEIQENHIDRLFDLFYLNPLNYLDFMPRIIDCGFPVTDEMTKELILIVKNLYDDDARNKIIKIIDSLNLEKSNDLCQTILLDLEDVNYRSKIFLLRLLSRNYVNTVEIFIEFVKVIGNERNIECLLQMLAILKSHKVSFYRKIQDWKVKENLSKILFRIYPLDYEDKEFYKKLCVKHRKSEEYSSIIKFYENELK